MLRSTCPPPHHFKMPPKKQPPPSPTASATASATPDINSQLEELKTLINTYSEKFDRLEGILKTVKDENKEMKKEMKELKKTLGERDDEILGLRERLNDQEQYARSWSIRILGMQVPAEDATHPTKVMRHVHSRLLLPIFRGAVDNGLLRSIPDADQVLETAHILPAKPNAVPAIICRFYSRNIRALVFKLKREFAPRLEPDQPAREGQAARPGRFEFAVFEDLTRANFAKLRALSQHEKVFACWSVSGSLRYRLKDSDVVKKVKTVFCSVEDIIGAS